MKENKILKLVINVNKEWYNSLNFLQKGFFWTKMFYKAIINYIKKCFKNEK